jgi:acyl-CoA thioesterase
VTPPSQERLPAFDRDTWLEPAAQERGQTPFLRWRGAVRPNWSNGDGPGINGGLFAALTARASELATGIPARSLTIHYLAAPAVGEVEIAAAVPRQGRTTAFLRLEFAQEGVHVAQAVAVCTQWRADAPSFSDARPPDLAPLEDCLALDPNRSHMPPMLANYDLRADTRPELRPAIGGWIRTADPRPSDHVALAAMSDAFIPPAFFRTGEPVLVPTLELTMHFRGEPPEGDHPWIGAIFNSRVAAGGVVEEDGELWSEDGRMLVQSRQLALMRRRPQP